MGLNASRGCARKSIDITRPFDIISSIIYVVFSGNQFTAMEALYVTFVLNRHAGKMKIHTSDFLKYIRMALTRHYYCVGAAPDTAKKWLKYPSLSLAFSI